ncbi:hypothetical protein CPB83DRAFT_734805, partial [Crepidotus variabilis]
MVNPGIFIGSRKTFLAAQSPLYAEAVAQDKISEYLGDVQHRYFKHYPIDIPLDQEPSAEWLESVDNNAADTE